MISVSRKRIVALKSTDVFSIVEGKLNSSEAASEPIKLLFCHKLWPHESLGSI
jgi:hypothetical protein